MQSVFCSLQGLLSLSVVAPLCLHVGFLHAGVDLWKRNLQLLVPFLMQPRITLYSTQILQTVGHGVMDTAPKIEVRDREPPKGPSGLLASSAAAAPSFAEGATLGSALQPALSLVWALHDLCKKIGLWTASRNLAKALP
jgi:hypothetical protein